ncbi:MAG: hypothetical protein WA609_19140 [Terriglobales bacterium]
MRVTVPRVGRARVRVAVFRVPIFRAAVFRRSSLLLGFVSLALMVSLVACHKPPQPVSDADATTRTTGLESIPPGDPSKYPHFDDMRGWKNPYFVVREDGIGLVDLSNREVHILTPEQIPAELVSLGSDAWPYGRVVLVAEAAPKNPTDAAKAEIRKNRGLLMGTLKELDVAVQEAP